jgi:hypothetical protein
MDLRSLNDDQLNRRFQRAMRRGDTATADAALREADRRDRRDERNARKREFNRARWNETRAAWYAWAHAQFLAAEKFCRGHMLSKAGRAADLDPWTLWTGNTARATRYASEELLEFWAKNPRMTVTEFDRQVSAQRRAERMALAA